MHSLTHFTSSNCVWHGTVSKPNPATPQGCSLLPYQMHLMHYIVQAIGLTMSQLKGACFSMSHTTGDGSGNALLLHCCRGWITTRDAWSFTRDARGAPGGWS
jgi:hypothetical protein